MRALLRYLLSYDFEARSKYATSYMAGKTEWSGVRSMPGRALLMFFPRALNQVEKAITLN